MLDAMKARIDREPVPAWHHGTMHQMNSPLEFVQRLATQALRLRLNAWRESTDRSMTALLRGIA